MNKKVVSSILAGAMALTTMGTSVFAVTAGDKEVTAAGQTTFKISAAVAAPVISVTIPSNVSAVINPYGVSIQIKGQADPVGAGGVSSVNYKIVNKTTTSKIKVKATPTITIPTYKDTANGGKVTAKMDFVASIAAAEGATDHTKKAIYAEVVSKVLATAAEENDAAVTALLATDLTGATGSGVKNVPFTNITVAEVGGVADKDAAAAATAATKTELMVLPQATAEVPESAAGAGDGVAATYGYGIFAVTGGVDAEADWTTSDKVALNLVLDLGPCA